MKSRWLPTMPIHAANWLADPRIQMLQPDERCWLLEALLRSWMLGKAIVVPAPIAEAYSDLWPEYDALRAEHIAAYEKRVEQRRIAAGARWNTPEKDRAAMRAASEPQCGTEGTPTPTPTPTKQKPQPVASQQFPRKRGNDTWLTPFGDAWRARYGGEPPWGRLGSALSPLCERHGAERVLRAWIAYLSATEGEFASPQRFASTFGRWDGTAPASQKIDPRGPTQNIPSVEETRARFAAEDEERRRLELRKQALQVAL